MPAQSKLRINVLSLRIQRTCVFISRIPHSCLGRELKRGSNRRSVSISFTQKVLLLPPRHAQGNTEIPRPHPADRRSRRSPRHAPLGCCPAWKALACFLVLSTADESETTSSFPFEEAGSRERKEVCGGHYTACFIAPFSAKRFFRASVRALSPSGGNESGGGARQAG